MRLTFLDARVSSWQSYRIKTGIGVLLYYLFSTYAFNRISATQAVTCSHPSVVERVASGNGSGRCILWAPEDLD